MSETRERRDGVGREKNEGQQTIPTLLNLCITLQRKTLIGFSVEICQHLTKTRQPLSTLDIITISRITRAEQITGVQLL